jgi:peptidoglycan hydrolase CwlO-like protein
MRRQVAIAVLMLFSSTLVTWAFSAVVYGNPNPEDIRRRVRDTRTEITELEQLIAALEGAIRSRAQHLNRLERELRETEAGLSRTRAESSAARARFDEANRRFAGRLRSIYMQGRLSYLELLLQAESLGDLAVRWGYLRRILRHDLDMISAIQRDHSFLQDSAITLEREAQRMGALRHQINAERRNLAAQEREKRAVLAAAQGRLAADLALITPQAERLPVYGVILDNAPPARPQHGLNDASTIYEYEVEGRITRYLALFSSFPAKIGPVRSVRSHSAMLALENNVHLLYAGGGLDVLDRIRGWDVQGTDALRSSSASFFRDGSRRAPHNLYVNLSTFGLLAPSTHMVIRPAYLGRQGTPALRIELEYSPDYRISYLYVEEKGAYRRHINGQVHQCAAGAVVYARNVIIQYVPHGTDLFRRPTPDLIGEGDIDFHAMGEHFRGRWRKESTTSPTRFFFLDGQEIERVYGRTWIQIVRQP